MRPGLKPLQNLKNTCYINSVIQLLSHIEPLKEEMQSLPKELPDNFKLLKEFSLLLKQIWNEISSKIEPVSFVETVFSTFKDFPAYTQQDSQEFLTVFLDKIDYSLMKLKKSERSLINEMFFGKIIYSNKCCRCSAEKESFDTVLGLSCSIPSGAKMSNKLDSFLDREEIGLLSTKDYSFLDLITNPTFTKAHLNIYYCLKEYFDDQKIEAFCQNCCDMTEHASKARAEKIPDYLFINLKRFKYQYWNRKVSDQVFITKELNLGRITKIDGSSEYVLSGLIEHWGLVFKGHYRAYLRIDNEWWVCDDKRVKKCSFEQVFNAQVYIALYVKKEIWEARNRPSDSIRESQYEIIPRCLTEENIEKDEFPEYEIIDHQKNT